MIAHASHRIRIYQRTSSKIAHPGDRKAKLPAHQLNPATDRRH
jgi:hypothetical protein